MLFDKNENIANDRILYKTKPNMILGCKKAIYGFVLLVIILLVSPMAIQFIGEMQVYLISYVKLSLTRYAAIAFFVLILITVVYIIWQLVAWHSKEYILTESRVIVKSGVLSTKKNYMPYSTIQDVNSSQSILARLFNVGTVSVFSAYDNNLMELSNISNPSKVEEIIFSHIVGPRGYNQQVPRYQQVPRSNIQHENDYFPRNDYYDEYEPITPITHERTLNQKREYEYYPEDFTFEDERPSHNYEYEPYGDDFDRVMDNVERQNEYSQGSYYNEVRDEYSYGGDDYYQNNEPQQYYNEPTVEPAQNDSGNVDDSPQKAIRRHFDKFKK